jgi:hypothetical protein
MGRLAAHPVFLTVLLPAFACATPMIEPARDQLRVEFENGDSATILCRHVEDDPCALDLRVNGRNFHFDSASLGAGILPERVILYSGPNSGRDKYFSFDVSVVCPEEVMLEDYDCEASVLVQHDKPHEVDIHRRKHEDFDYEPAPDTAPRYMRWWYTLTSPSKERLERLAPVLVAMGYRNLFGVEEARDPWSGRHVGWKLLVDRKENYTAETHARRKGEFAELAAKYDVRLKSVELESAVPDSVKRP